MHITNLVSDEDRPEVLRKPDCVVLDLDDWVAVDEQPRPKAYDASNAIAKAAAANAKAMESRPSEQSVGQARALTATRFAATAETIKQETGFSVGFQAWAYQPKPQAAYNLWKKVVPMFNERSDVLDLGPTALAKMLDAREEAFTVTRDMLYDKLNNLAVKDLDRLLRKLGVTMILRRPVSIRSLRQQFIERRDALAGVQVETFSGHFAIRGDTVLVNGRPYKIQEGKSGKPRIQFEGSWLRVDVLRAICLQTKPSG